MGYAQQKSVTNSELSISEITKKINDLGQACWNLRLTHSDSAANLGHQAISLAEKYDILEPIPRISNYLGVVYMHCLHKEKESIPYFHQALEFGIQNKDSTSISYAYNNLGDAYLLIGNVPLSKHYSLISLDIFERLQSPLGIAYGYVNMGLVDRIDKAYSSSLVYFKKAIEINLRRI